MSFKLSKATTAICASMLMLFSTNVKAQTRDRAAFFASPQAIPEQYDKDGLFPTGRSLPFGFYSFGGGTENKRGEIPDMDQRFYDQNQIAAGRYVNMIGPAYELNKFILDDAKRCKIPCIYSVFSSSELETLEVDGEVMSKNTFDAMAKEGREPNWDHVAQVIKDIVAKVADSPWIYAWNVPPEELRSWSKMDMKMLDVATKAIREADPHHRPLLMYLPNHYGAKTMKPFFPSLDIVAKGAYVNYAGQKTSRAWVRWTMEQEQIAYPEGIHYLLPEMFQDAKPEEREMIPAWVRHDVYCGLANGAKGILIFSASRRPNFQCRNLYLNCYLEIAEELNGSRRLGEAYLYGEPRNDLKLDVIAGPATVHVKHFDSQKDYSSLSFLNLAWKNARYLTIVNSANEPVTAVLDNLPYGSDIVLEDLTGQTGSCIVPEGNVTLTFEPLEAKVLRVMAQQEQVQAKKELWSSLVRKGIADIGVPVSRPVEWQGKLLRLDYCPWNDSTSHYYANFVGQSYQCLVLAGTGEPVSPPLALNSLPGTVFVADGLLTVLYPRQDGGFASISSSDLKNWSEPTAVSAPENALNPAVSRLNDKWFMAYETKDGKLALATADSPAKWSKVADIGLAGRAPCLLSAENKLFLVFTDNDGAKIACSRDGDQWTVAKDLFLSPAIEDAKSLTTFPPALEMLARDADNHTLLSASIALQDNILKVFYSWKKPDGTIFLSRAEGTFDFSAVE